MSGANPLSTLLARLANDGTTAGEAYEILRRRLVTYFRLHFPASAEMLADEALDRLGRRAGEGTSIDNVALYALGIARLLVQETRGRLAREQRAIEESARRATLADDPAEIEMQQRALSACLEQLGAAPASLLLEYYGADGAARIDGRKRLADSLGLTLNALRNRALRWRGALEQCVRGRLEASGAPNQRDESVRKRT